MGGQKACFLNDHKIKSVIVARRKGGAALLALKNLVVLFHYIVVLVFREEFIYFFFINLVELRLNWVMRRIVHLFNVNVSDFNFLEL
jgi:hypothetical protein